METFNACKMKSNISVKLLVAQKDADVCMRVRIDFFALVMIIVDRKSCWVHFMDKQFSFYFFRTEVHLKGTANKANMFKHEKIINGI
jgi:hypothetical protein